MASGSFHESLRKCNQWGHAEGSGPMPVEKVVKFAAFIPRVDRVGGRNILPSPAVCIYMCVYIYIYVCMCVFLNI